MDSDIAIIRTVAPMVYSSVVKAAAITGTLYNLPDNQVVWAAGFGASIEGNSEQLRHIQIWTVNQAACILRYNLLGANVTANMVCAGLFNTGSGSQCAGDSGGPLFHNGVVGAVRLTSLHYSQSYTSCLISHSLHYDFAFTGNSAVDRSAGVLRGRPYGGAALLWRKTVFPTDSVILCKSDRLVAIRINHNDKSLSIFSEYMPTDSAENVVVFIDTLNEIIAVYENSDVESVFI
ncbi:unnamed protein product [Arctia plantaginis]|uniref:Peptidase S1 domain-containing protein n=1 Tax=Arctia plantaginis TaxID=874455 RepID=A0A8S1BD21_ARCPL|nr:unnamed protein product [Arctia plantaginis]